MTTLNLRNPNGYDGQPGTQHKQGIVRLATNAEAVAGTAQNVVITPAQLAAAVAGGVGANFASPPVLGFGSTTPRPVHSTTLASSGNTDIGTGASSVINIGAGASSTVGFFGATAVIKPTSTTDLRTALINLGLYTTGGASPLNLNGGALSAGTLAATTTLVAGTTITATLGNIIATNGNFVSSTAGKGIVLNSGTASGATTATLNGRSGQITITAPSIAAGANFVFTLTNSSVTASTTQIIYGLTGGTLGAAITIESVVNSASTSTITLMNGSGDTASTADLVLTFLVLN